MKSKNVLFLCTANSCRSQMAEGWARQLLAGVINPHSAGVATQGLDQRAVQVMREVGVDISGQVSKSLDDLPDLEFDAVVTLCDQAKESCPFFPGTATRLHRSFEDPAVLARDAVDEASTLQPYRRVRDEIREFVRQLPDMLE
ncbi:MAG: arsenate reductase ArsC [Desulfohalobiaceae bacterium]|nr:arsenate reductase ArsC [Desulfohalobiaceae bacterium]